MLADVYHQKSGRLSQRMNRGLSRGVLIGLAVATLVCIHLVYSTRQSAVLDIPLEDQLDHARGKGGVWHIPPSWTASSESPLAENANILDAAKYALDLAQGQRRFLNNTGIPRSLHQTWRTSDVAKWPDATRATVASWTPVINGDGSGSEMAWFLWDDDGIEMLLKNYEADLADGVMALPYPVEKADVMRIVAVKWFGGIYADADTVPLKHPDLWVMPGDDSAWTNALSSSEAPATREIKTPSVNAIFGIEADNPPEPDTTYWRMGYRWPVQLTNWALAMAPHHPVADEFLTGLAKKIADHRDNLGAVNPLDITGPPIVTETVRELALKHDPSFVWDSLSGRNGDPKGGRSKLVAKDVIILPITGFSPGRGYFQNMGSQSIEHPNACLQHKATGTWRKTDFKVAYGKLCRSLFGLCRDWEDIQAPT